MQRRSFLEFLGTGTVLSFAPGLWSCNREITKNKIKDFILKGLDPIEVDALKLAEDLDFQILVKWGDSISSEDYFGYNNDYTAFIPSKENKDEGILWVNHEYVDPFFISDFSKKTGRTKAQVDQEMYNVGGSLLRIKKENDEWKLIHDHKNNRRLNGHTMIPFNWHEPIAGKTEAMGTMANCSGGITPWGTILTCEENYDAYYGERDYKTGKRINGAYGWEQFYDNAPEHYGWVVEVNPETGEAQKHIALGRCAHECATVFQLKDGRVVVYTGDDANDECLYKFISSTPNSLKEGTLYVANLEKGKWESLDYNSRPELQEKFKNQTEVLIRLREASKLVGGTPLDRPEDIEIDPLNGNILVSLTNNKPKGNYHGSILKLTEKDVQHDALTFEASTYLAGGTETGFSCPDNMAFDTVGNLWFTSDISGSSMNKAPYEAFKNNGLFVVPRSGSQAGKVIQVASAPTDAELTGPFFTEDGKTLFLSVQHPGESSSPQENIFTSNWPEGGKKMPKSAVVCISGKTLDKLQSLI